MADTGSTVECSDEAETCSILAEDEIEFEEAEDGSPLVLLLLRGRFGIHLRTGFSVEAALAEFAADDVGNCL